jgi:pentatricopeptide repeat protein
VFDEMRKLGQLPDSETIATVMNAYGKLREFDKAAALYQAMREEGCVFSDRAHFQMIQNCFSHMYITSKLARANNAARFDKVILIYDSFFIFLKSLTLNFHVDIGASIS